MKPTKSLVYCYGCNRRKMLFTTQEKADNFIKFNKEEILDEKGRAPVRSYYCRLCNGYHVTSNPSLTEGEIRDKSDEKLLQDVIKCIEIEKACKIKKKVEKGLKEDRVSKEEQASLEFYYNLFTKDVHVKTETAKSTLLYGRFVIAESLYKECLDTINSISWPPKLEVLIKQSCDKINEGFKIIEFAKSLISLSQDERNHRIAALDTSKQEMYQIIISNHLALDAIEKELNTIQDLLDKKETKGVLERLNRCVATLAEMKNIYKHRKLLSDFESRINDLKRALHILKESDMLMLKKEQDYKQTLLDLIEQLKKIEDLYNNGNYLDCRNLIDLCVITLDNLDVVDDNTKLLRKHFDMWEEKAMKEL